MAKKWKTRLRGHGSSSPIISGEKIFVTCYCISDEGVARCLRPASGEIVDEERLPRIAPWSSPVLAEGKIYVVGTRGRVAVLAAGPKYEELAVNEMGDGGRFHATPAVDGSRLLIRSDDFLYCVGRSS